MICLTASSPKSRWLSQPRLKTAAVLRPTLMEKDRMGSFERALRNHLGQPSLFTDGDIEALSR